MSVEAALANPLAVMDLFDPEDRARLNQVMYEAAQRGSTDGWCGRVTIDGKEKWITVTARGTVLPTGEVVYDGVAMDDTRRQEELIESKSFLHSVIENMPDMVMIKDAQDLGVVLVNKVAEQILGLERSEILGRPHSGLLSSEQSARFIDRDRHVLEGREVVTYPNEEISTRANGTRILHTRKIPLIDINGVPKYLLGISEDVTDRVRTEEALMESQDRLNAILKHTTTPIFLHDEDGRVILFNESALQMTGKRVDEILGSMPEDFMSPRAADAYREAEATVQSTGRAVETEEVVESEDGPKTFITIRFPLIDLHGQVYATGAIATEITERKRIMDEASRAREDAEAANQAKSAFLSRMSHELRTPLNAILGFAQLLDYEDLSEGQRDSVSYILGAGHHLLRLINEVLDISRIESGNFSISVEPVQVKEVVYEAVNLVKPQADTAEVRVQIGEISDDAFVVADRQRLLQSLINLISNAVKYNCEKGSVEVSYRMISDQEGEIRVLDTGKGIPEDKRDRLFVPFDRLGAESSGIEGTGLGLSLSKRLIEAMRGKMGLAHSDENGSTFFIRLPSSAAPEDYGTGSSSRTLWDATI